MSEPLTREQVEQIKDYKANFTFDELVLVVVGLNAQRAQTEKHSHLLESYHKHLMMLLGYDLQNPVHTDPTIADKIMALKGQLAQVTAERDQLAKQLCDDEQLHRDKSQLQHQLAEALTRIKGLESEKHAQQYQDMEGT